MRHLLFLDCYVEDDATPTWGPVLAAAGRPVTAVRVARDGSLPDPSRFAGVLMSGSAACLPDGVPWAPRLLRWMDGVLDANVPYLGVCWGHQVLGEVLGGSGTVVKRDAPEVGVRTVRVLDPSDPLLGTMPPAFDVMISHEDEVAFAPAGTSVIASSQACPIHGLRVDGRDAWGVQFHAEMARVEVAALLGRRARRHPELGLDPSEELVRYDGAPPVRDRMFRAFFDMVDAREG